jgi:NADH:ubiquinone oxidoreductase subunit 3 (subunit A)
MADNIIFSPPILFFVVLTVVACSMLLFSKLAFKPLKKPAEGQGKPYACGENITTHMIQPDYTQFFPFAFYFTILHVVALMLALVPIETFKTFFMAIIYILGAVIGLKVLYRR